VILIVGKSLIMPLPKSLPTPSNPSASGTTFYGSATINAPASIVWQKLLDFSDYTSNTFTPVVEFPSLSSHPLQPGDQGSLDAYVGANDESARPTKVQITLVDEKNHKFGWKGLGLPTWALRPERVQEVVDLGDGQCEYRTWETMGGPGAMVVNWMMGTKLDKTNKRCGGDLKRMVEEGNMAPESCMVTAVGR